MTASSIASHYSRFRVSERLLLTGHSHQAWPDVGLVAQQQAWLDAAEHLDHKWTLAEAEAERVREGWRRLLGEPVAEIAFAANTHELVVRFLSALPLDKRARLVTTDGEFHSIRRQLDRLSETGLEVVKVPARPVDTLAERLARAATPDTSAILVSSVLFETSEIVPGLSDLAAQCAADGVELLVDAYHHLNVVEFDVEALGLTAAFIVGGGYKYCQLGEGNAFMRVPPGCRLRPVITGWFAEFAAIESGAAAGHVAYGAGASRFAGATYDPVSHYRAAAVFDFHQAQGLTVPRLRAISQAQIARLVAAFEERDLARAGLAIEPMPSDRRAGFLAIRARDAAGLARALNSRGLWCDARGCWLRLGPAPYVTDQQLDEAVAVVAEVVTA
jgi:kynureninase